jgi:RND family efflux transporter MFP subunit
MIRRLLTLMVIVAAAAAGIIYFGDRIPPLLHRPQAHAKVPEPHTDAALAVTVAAVRPADFVDAVLVTGTLVPREEILIGPEIEGLRVQELLVEEGDTVAKGQTLARLTTDSLEAQLAQNDAALARSDAAIAQATSQIAQAQARVVEADNALERSRPLRSSGVVSQSVFESREATAKTSRAQLEASRDALKVAQAEKRQVQAQRREIEWRRGNAEVKSPADGVVLRRTARVGGVALAAAEPMFRILARGEVELEADVIETVLYKIRPGQVARVAIAGIGDIEGKVRLVSPEVDKATRLGKVRIYLGANPGLRVGSFARGTLEVARSRGLAVPSSAILFSANGRHVHAVREGKVATVAIATGLTTGALTEVKSGLEDGDVVIAKSGTFLREGDAVRPIGSERSALAEKGDTRVVQSTPTEQP